MTTTGYVSTSQLRQGIPDFSFITVSPKKIKLCKRRWQNWYHTISAYCHAQRLREVQLLWSLEAQPNDFNSFLVNFIFYLQKLIIMPSLWYPVHTLTTFSSLICLPPASKSSHGSLLLSIVKPWINGLHVEMIEHGWSRLKIQKLLD